MCYELEINPRDVMYFRDGSPIGASSDGSGAMWPLPSTFYSALMSALHNRFPERNPDFETEHKTEKMRKSGITGDPNMKTSKMRFGGLRTWGPFPKVGNTIYVPTPLDLVVGGVDNSSGGIMNPVNILGSSNLPKPIKYPVASTVKPSKKELGEWLPLYEFVKYLKGETVGLKTVCSSELFTSESRPGIAIDAKTGTTEEGKFYSAEYLRLNRGVSMASFAECEAKRFGNDDVQDMLAEFFKGKKLEGVIFGGQRGVVWLENKRDRCRESPISIERSPNNSRLVKWVLLSPAYFKQGWLPGWLDEDGKVMLKEKVERGTMSRKEWRDKINNAPEISAKLVAARNGKPIVASGWKLDKDADNAGGSAKATRLYVPAGSVYYFECENEAEAAKLVKVLHGQTKSDALGEKGFGLGVCSTWKLGTI